MRMASPTWRCAAAAERRSGSAWHYAGLQPHRPRRHRTRGPRQSSASMSNTLFPASTSPARSLSPSCSNGAVLIPRGTPVRGRIDEAHRRGHFKGRSVLELRLVSMTLNGYRIRPRHARHRSLQEGQGQAHRGLHRRPHRRRHAYRRPRLRRRRSRDRRQPQAPALARFSPGPQATATSSFPLKASSISGSPISLSCKIPRNLHVDKRRVCLAQALSLL